MHVREEYYHSVASSTAPKPHDPRPSLFGTELIQDPYHAFRVSGMILGPVSSIPPCSHPMNSVSPDLAAIASKTSEVSLAPHSGFLNATTPSGLLTGSLAEHGTIGSRASP